MKSVRRTLSPIKRTLLAFARNQFRRKPDFVIIGAQKSGTTSLYHYIVQHPEIEPASKKEIKFFDIHFSEGEKWYLSHFPPKYPWADFRITGEGSPEYMYLPWAANRLIEFLPETKLVAVLRNPVERAISQYFYEIRRSPAIENLPIMDALLAEEDRIANEIKQPKTGGWSDSLMYRRASYKKRGIYIEQIKRFDDYWNDGRLLVLQSETLFRDPMNTMRKVFQFLEVHPGYQCVDLTPRNIGENRTFVTADVYEYLDLFFKPHNHVLFDYLGEDFNW